MADTNTLRVLSLDGGGIKGYISSTFMQLFVQQWGIDPTKIFQYFDVITGTSVGAIQALAYAYGLTPAQLQSFFLTEGPWIFSTSSLIPGQTASDLSKIASILLGSSFYSNDALIAKLNAEFGTTTLAQMNTNVVIPAYNYDTNSLTLFSNVNFPGSTGPDLLAQNVALASASAPFYFPAAVVNGANYIDGGVYLNNPSTMGLAVGKLLKPNANRYCVLSVGCGLGDIGFHTNPTPVDPPPPDPPPYNSNVYTIFNLIGIGITGPQEANARELLIQDDYTLDNLNSYRFQFNIDPTQNSEIDNTSSAFFTYMLNAATAQFNTDITDITNFLAALQA